MGRGDLLSWRPVKHSPPQLDLFAPAPQPGSPTSFAIFGSALFDVCRRAEAGEFTIWAVDVKGARYTVQVSYPAPIAPREPEPVCCGGLCILRKRRAESP